MYDISKLNMFTLNIINITNNILHIDILYGYIINTIVNNKFIF